MAYFNHRTSVIVTVLVIIFLFFAVPAFAEKVTFVKEYTYQASELDSKASCRTISLEMVKRLLLEELGTYLISETEVKDFKLTKDQVTTYSAGIVSAEVIEDKWDGKTYWLKARVSADPKEAAKTLKKIMDDQFKGKELEGTRKKAEELTKEVERLKLELAKTTNKQPSEKVQQEYKTAIQGLTANEWFNKGSKASLENKRQEAIEAYTKAIELKPDYLEAYNNRGNAYSGLGNYKKAIKDSSKAIDLKPDLADAYVIRGFTYDIIGNYQQAIKDYNKAIELKSDDAVAYWYRGATYYNLGNYQQTIKDYNKAIELKPNEAEVFWNRALAYSKLGNYQQAIKDLNKAIELKPDFAEAYQYRGLTYVVLGNEKLAKANLQIAARLGNKTAQDFLKEKGIKW